MMVMVIEVGRDIVFDVLRDFDCLPLVAEARQNLDKAP
jgi:hypothetical protein